ncbi:M48 family metalloprotease [Chondrinema litorale]|uniref:M48 family metalloprotease n=1 Tax=Chondrinema litorale TaxID=2994555 RepID=UPI002542CD0B|nr:M48 family metalloprotease [Chondrinema litorale]UZR99244.1 M48 family metalloprotease [Chondrinema litorale]
MLKKLFFPLLLIFLLSCDKDGDLNFFSVEQDKEFGEQVKTEIESSGEYNLMSRSAYPEAYSHLDRITNTILNSGEVQHLDNFNWEVFLIDEDVLNAFATPGGKLYVYTGLIKYLETEDQLAGVMGHEIAHSDKRHSTDALTRQYGFQLLLEIILGENQQLLKDIAGSLASLQYSRKNESEADETSVEYLGNTIYNCAGAAGFFEKMIEEGSTGGTPEFLSTHPNPDNRVEAIYEKADEENCSTETSNNSSQYQDFQNSLP